MTTAQPHPPNPPAAPDLTPHAPPAAGPTARRYAPDAICSRCAYSLAGLTMAVCPECGAQLPDPTGAVAEQRKAALSELPGREGHLAITSLGIITLYTLIICVAYDPAIAGIAGFAIVLGVIATGLAALLIRALFTRDDGRLAAIGWYQSAWILHIPWLALGPHALLVSLAAAINAQLFLILAWLSVGLLGAAALLLAPKWSDTWEAWCDRVGLPGGELRPVIIRRLAMALLGYNALVSLVLAIIVNLRLARWLVSL